MTPGFVADDVRPFGCLLIPCCWRGTGTSLPKPRFIYYAVQEMRTWRFPHGKRTKTAFAGAWACRM